MQQSTLSVSGRSKQIFYEVNGIDILVMQLSGTNLVSVVEVRKRVKLRNRYNHAPHLAQATNGIVTTSQLDITNEIEPIGQPFPSRLHLGVHYLLKPK